MKNENQNLRISLHSRKDGRMITKLSLELDFSEKLLGFTLENTKPTKIGKGVKVYIPVLMSDIGKENPDIKKLNSKGRAVFINAQDCKPRAAQILHERNYLEAKRETNASIVKLLEKNKTGKNYQIPKDSRLEIECVMGKLSSLTFSTNKFINESDESSE